MNEEAVELMTSDGKQALRKELEDYMDVPMNIAIEFGRTKLSIRDILNLSYNSIVSIPKSAGENVDVLANGKLIAFGEIITVEETTGVIITDIADE